MEIPYIICSCSHCPFGVVRTGLVYTKCHKVSSFPSEVTLCLVDMVVKLCDVRGHLFHRVAFHYVNIAIGLWECQGDRESFLFCGPNERRWWRVTFRELGIFPLWQYCLHWLSVVHTKSYIATTTPDFLVPPCQLCIEVHSEVLRSTAQVLCICMVDKLHAI